MSEETAPQQGGAAMAAPSRGLLQQMEELLAALNANLSALDVGLRSTGASRRMPGDEGTAG
ncbi:hypothetical protein GCM10010269_07030 [Streptomyces humidus]|uniref:Uncharacterized protein n=1 Tax=Streptomyces humidus TaxID=52259 RepID=A0A918L126_9ACTN|nr:hypothetical protein [Streptomyces humidus]GGR70717.1 hypothetical protein GCM10010269_07030 [Streptomyces humidus]